MKIAIGPIEGHYGGAAQHILNIIEYSKYSFDKITIPVSLKRWNKFFKNCIIPIKQFIPYALEHSNKRFDMYGLQKFFDLPGFKKSIFELPKYDIVHLHGYPYWERIYNTARINSVFTVHNLYNKEDFPPNWAKTLEYLTRNLLRICKNSEVISVAKWLQESMQKNYGIKSTYIPNGVNLKEFDYRDADKFRKKFKIEDEFYLFVGRATRYKRPELFVNLAERFPKRKFVMIGRALTETGLSKYLGRSLPRNLICLGEPEREDVVNAFDASRVVILTSTNETFGIVLLEGMASKKPVIGANNLGPKEIIDHRKTGFLFESENLESLIKHAELAWYANDIGLAAREKVENYYDWKYIIPQIEEVYDKMLK
jgi:phosphatidylinositol alpha-mannosyltransferase